MGKLDKTLCEWTRTELREHLPQLRVIVAQPKFVCTKCGRAAGDKAYLCKPKPL